LLQWITAAGHQREVRCIAHGLVMHFGVGRREVINIVIVGGGQVLNDGNHRLVVINGGKGAVNTEAGSGQFAVWAWGGAATEGSECGGEQGGSNVQHDGPFGWLGVMGYGLRGLAPLWHSFLVGVVVVFGGWCLVCVVKVFFFVLLGFC